LKDLENAEKTLNMALKVNPNAWTTAYYFSLLHTQKEEFPTALEYLEKALKNGMTDVETINSDPDLAPLRAAPEFKTLMKKHFPEKFKD
jgi:tetratricopeptide (TPR) repeat protein